MLASSHAYILPPSDMTQQHLWDGPALGRQAVGLVASTCHCRVGAAADLTWSTMSQCEICAHHDDDSHEHTYATSSTVTPSNVQAPLQLSRIKTCDAKPAPITLDSMFPHNFCACVPSTASRLFVRCCLCLTRVGSIKDKTMRSITRYADHESD